MNFKDVVIKLYNENKSYIHSDFIRRMCEAVEVYEKHYEEGFKTWCNYPTVIDIKGRRVGKLEFLRQKCIGLIAMDRMQIEAAELLKVELTANDTALQNQLSAAKVSSSVWFSGDPNTPAYH
ncbi:hypothetical protein [Enterobacter phage vB-EclM_KMB17]|nr:hypothetical protein KKP3262_000057 [Enterobacter phage KKP_3262]UKH49484.1 hypothetical protein [Enterobacter phage vB-EclM_KMB17]